MSTDLLLLAPSLLLVGAVAGSYFERGLNAHMWKRHGYCPNCDHLSDDDQIDMREPEESFCADCPDHEGCMQGIPCGLVKRVHDIARGRA